MSGRPVQIPDATDMGNTAHDPLLQRAPDGALHVLAMVVRHLRLLVLYPIALTTVVVLISLLFPNYYRSTILILPPERSFQSMDIGLGELATFAAGGMALPLMATPSDILDAVVMSRTVRDSLISRLDLANRWNMARNGAASRLSDETGSKVHNSGIVEVWATDRNRFFADTLVNTMAEEADNLNRRIVNTKARRTREFVEQRLNETRADLETAAIRLQRFQNEHKTVALEAQISALIQNAADLKAQLTADEIELSVLETSHSAEHPRVRHLRSRIQETQRRLNQLITSGTEGGPAGNDVIAFGLEGMPKLVQELAEITRDLKVAEGVYSLLAQQYENARIQERRDTPSFSVLDWASHGGAKVRPKRFFIALSTMLVSFSLILAFILSREYYERLEETDPIRHREIRAILQSLPGVRSRRSGGKSQGHPDE